MAARESSSSPRSVSNRLELARVAGIDVPRTRLVSIASIGNLPAEAARLGGQALAKYKSVSYANMARVLWAEAGPDAAYEFIRRIALSVLIGNADMHLKNWSILYRDRRKATLSPAYDFVATLPYLPADRLALTFGGARSLAEISADQIRPFCRPRRAPGVTRATRDRRNR